MRTAGRTVRRDGVAAAVAGLALVLIGCAAPSAVAPPATPALGGVPPVAPSKPAPPDQVRRTADFVAVVVQPGDSLASLAALYLSDPGRDWEIAAFNGIEAVAAGQEIVIPLKSFRRGGLAAERYQTVPVLSYHHFGEKSTDKMTVSREAFESQMRLLREKGYRVITLEALFDFMDLRGQLPEKSVVITIDDGWRSTYDIAFPILKKYGYPATLFVYTQLITGSAKTLSWDLLREMASQGLDIQCHTITHRNLAQQNDGESLEQYLNAVQREVAESARTIEQKLGRKPQFLAYPYGETGGVVIALLKKNGFRGALTVLRESNPFFLSNFRLNRAMIYGDFDLARFEKNLAVTDRKAWR